MVNEDHPSETTERGFAQDCRVHTRHLARFVGSLAPREYRSTHGAVARSSPTSATFR